MTTKFFLLVFLFQIGGFARPQIESIPVSPLTLAFPQNKTLSIAVLPAVFFYAKKWAPGKPLVEIIHDRKFSKYLKGVNNAKALECLAKAYTVQLQLTRTNLREFGNFGFIPYETVLQRFRKGNLMLDSLFFGVLDGKKKWNVNIYNGRTKPVLKRLFSDVDVLIIPVFFTTKLLISKQNSGQKSRAGEVTGRIKSPPGVQPKLRSEGGGTLVTMTVNARSGEIIGFTQSSGKTFNTEGMNPAQLLDFWQVLTAEYILEFENALIDGSRGNPKGSEESEPPMPARYKRKRKG